MMLARAALAAQPDERRAVAPAVRDLARALIALSLDPGDHLTRQGAVDRVLDVSRAVAQSGLPTDPAIAAAMAVRAVASDVLMFAGVEPADAVAAVQHGISRFDVPTPPPAARVPFGSARRQADD